MEQTLTSVGHTTFIPAITALAESRIQAFTELLTAENRCQNLIAASTIPDLRRRHIDDSLQLLPLLRSGNVVDIGSGAGLPGLVLACASDHVMHLVEPRTRRAAFLTRAGEHLELGGRVVVHRSSAEALVPLEASNIVARAVASLQGLFSIAAHLATPDTRWVLPKGRSARIELEAVTQTWQGEFELVRSATDPSASIIVAEHVRRRQG